MLTGLHKLTIKYLDAVPFGVWLGFVTQLVSLAAAAQGKRPAQSCSLLNRSTSGVQLVLLGNSCLSNEQQV